MTSEFHIALMWNDDLFLLALRKQTERALKGRQMIKKALHCSHGSHLPPPSSACLFNLLGAFLRHVGYAQYLGHQPFHRSLQFMGVRILELAVGVLPYPVTFLCTDLISELRGEACERSGLDGIA